MNETLNQYLFDPLIGRVVGAAVGVVLVLMIRGVVHRRLINRVTDIDARYRARKAVSILAWAVVIFILIGVFSNQLGSFTVAFGVAGAGIAFALQEVIASIAGWIAIMFGRAFRVGDRIKLGGTLGDVIDIGVLRTTLMECGVWIDGDAYNGRIVTVANSFLFKEPLVNYTGHFPFLWDEITVPIAHGSDVNATTTLLQSVADAQLGDYARDATAQWSEMVSRYRIEDAQVRPLVLMQANENWMTFTLRYVVDYRARRTTKDAIWRRILAGIHDHPGIDVAGATLAIRAAPLDVTVATA